MLQLKSLSMAGSPTRAAPAPVAAPSDSETETGTESYYSDQDDVYL